MSWTGEISDTIRNDLCHLMTHGHCRYVTSRRLYEGFKAAHGGKAPEDMGYAVQEYPDKDRPHVFDLGERVGGEMFELMQWLDALAPEERASYQKDLESFNAT
ncbi:hypothetical protein ACFIOY_21390 [Bradyrhizobium sp. TZ2]